MSAAIEIRNLTKRYGSLTAVDSVSLTVDSGELFGLIGPDGAGKSTIYRILATLLAPDSGEVSMSGLDPRRDRLKLRTVIGYMPERFSLYPDLTVMENLRFFASLFGVDLKQNYDLVEPVFRQLERFPNRLAGKLSGGMKQKLALSCALIHRPKVLLLDEPTTGVDAVSRSEFWGLLGELREKGITMLVSTSYMDEATLCGRVAMIDHGRILVTGTPARLVGKIGSGLYSARSSDMFGLLGRLRTMDDVTDCYTFGATLHLMTTPRFDAAAAERQLRSEGFDDVVIAPARGDVEDLFIKLTDRDGK